MGVNSAKILAMPNGPEIGKRVYEARRRAGISANKLAQMVGTRHHHIRLLETGGIDSPGTELISRIASALDVPLAGLMGEAPLTPRYIGDAYEAVEDDPVVVNQPSYMEQVRNIQVNLQTLGELDEEALDTVQEIVEGLIERRMRMEKEERDAARRRRKAPDKAGPAD
jgi:transcriptional regulator with XRE-family HTH domain